MFKVITCSKNEPLVIRAIIGYRELCILAVYGSLVALVVNTKSVKAVLFNYLSWHYTAAASMVRVYAQFDKPFNITNEEDFLIIRTHLFTLHTYKPM